MRDDYVWYVRWIFFDGIFASFLTGIAVVTGFHSFIWETAMMAAGAMFFALIAIITARGIKK